MSLLSLAALTIPPSAQGAGVDDWSASGSADVVSNYVSRGLTQTWAKPALQGELEVEHDAGPYAGLFVSNVSRNQYPGGGVEAELWLGYEYEIDKDAALELEAIYFAYPGANYDHGACPPGPACPDQSFNTWEGRASARWRWLTASFAYAFSDYFGASPATGYQASTRGTWYAEANAAYPLPADETWELAAHVGYTRYSAQTAATSVTPAQDPSYWDWRVAVTKTLKDAYGAWRLGVYYTQASNASFYDNTRSLVDSSTINLGRPAFIVSVGRTF